MYSLYNFFSPKLAISQSKAVSSVLIMLISCNMKSLTRYGFDIMVTCIGQTDLGTVNKLKYLNVPFLVGFGSMCGSSVLVIVRRYFGEKT